MASVNERCRNDIKHLLRNGNDVGFVIKHIKETYGLSYNAAQKRVMGVRRNMGLVKTVVKDTTSNPPINPVKEMKVGEVATQSMTFDAKNNQTTYEGLLAIKPNQNVSQDYLIQQMGLSPLEWNVTGYRISVWDGNTKEDGLIQMHSFRVSVSPKKPSELTDVEKQQIIADVINKCMPDCNAIVKNLVKKNIKIKAADDGYVVEICLPDIHVGLLAWQRETTEDFDCRIVRKQVMYAIDQIYNKLVLFNVPIKKIMIVTLGDVLHVDNDVQTTTKGTFQQVDGRFPKIIETAFNLMFEIITKFATLGPVEYVYIPGNHDKDSGWQLAFTLSKVFANVDGITCDVEPNPHKYRRIGHVALGWTHGDANKKNLDGLLNMMIKDQTGIQYKCLHIGHLHSSHSHTSTDGGCYVEYLDSLCPASLWEHSQGYGKTPLRYVNAFLWDGTPTPPERVIGAVSK